MSSFLFFPALPSFLIPHSSFFTHHWEGLVGLTGLEPVTLRLSSACSNQLSYTPRALRANFKFEISNLKSKAGGAEEIRTPDL